MAFRAFILDKQIFSTIYMISTFNHYVIDSVIDFCILFLFFTKDFLQFFVAATDVRRIYIFFYIQQFCHLFYSSSLSCLQHNSFNIVLFNRIGRFSEFFCLFLVSSRLHTRACSLFWLTKITNIRTSCHQLCKTYWTGLAFSFNRNFNYFFPFFCFYFFFLFIKKATFSLEQLFYKNNFFVG